MDEIEKREPSGRFRPGTTGNPGGRPRLPPEIRDACREATPEVIARWRNEVETNGPDWLAASKLLMAYGWGTPTATLEIGRSDPQPGGGTVRIDVKKLTTEELQAYLVVQRAHRRLTADAAAAPSAATIG